MRPVACMISPTFDAGSASIQQWVSQAREAARAGLELVQVRQPGLDGGELLTIVRECVQAVASYTTRVIVNDRLDVALMASAHGVHLRGDSFAARRARRLTPPGFLIGRSVHTAPEAREVTAAGGLDYLMFGTTFPTTSKPGRVAAGVEQLAAVAASVSLPVLAVGGITLDRIPAVAASGAAGVAAINMFADTSVSDTAAQLRRRWLNASNL